MANEVFLKVIQGYELSVEDDDTGIIIQIDGKDIAWIGIDNLGHEKDLPAIAVASESSRDHIAWISYEPDGVRIIYSSIVMQRIGVSEAFYHNLKEI